MSEEFRKKMIEELKNRYPSDESGLWAICDWMGDYFMFIDGRHEDVLNYAVTLGEFSANNGMFGYIDKLDVKKLGPVTNEGRALQMLRERMRETAVEDTGYDEVISSETLVNDLIDTAASAMVGVENILSEEENE